MKIRELTYLLVSVITGSFISSMVYAQTAGNPDTILPGPRAQIE